jgi:hypothetical protein
MSNLHYPRWARVLQFVLAPIVLQPLMLVLTAFVIWLLLAAFRASGSYTSMMVRAWLLFAVGLAWLYFGRRVWWRRPYLVQVPAGFVLAPLYVYAFWVMISRSL